MEKEKKLEDDIVIHPSILYAGNPVALITTLNSNGETNISPMSSTWELGEHLVLGMTRASQGYENLRRERECVVNFPSSAQWKQVERLARTTGRNPVPEYKEATGYYFEPDKFTCAGFTPLESETVRPLRIAECPLQFEARLLALHESTDMAEDDPVAFGIFEMKVTRVHAHAAIVQVGTNHIDTTAWSPLLYVFSHYFGTGPDLGRTFKAEA